MTKLANYTPIAPGFYSPGFKPGAIETRGYKHAGAHFHYLRSYIIFNDLILGNLDYL